MQGLVDSHCHLDEAAAQTLERARAAGLHWVMDVGIDLASSRAAQARAAGEDGIEFSAGLHPCAADRFELEFDEIARLCGQPECRAVGETGLDLYWDKVPLEAQERSLRAHLALARRLDKPVILHCRDAFAELFEVLETEPGIRGVMHCFSGGPEAASRALELGYHLSFAGPLTYPRNEALREAARQAPANRILIETDAPYLPPQGHRGERNEPARLRLVAARLAAERGQTEAEIAALTAANAAALFGRSG